MKSAKCPECGFVGWADAEVCKRCGASITAHVDKELDQITPQYVGASDSMDSSYDHTHYQHYNAPAFQPDLKKGLAVTSLVLGIVNLLLLGITGITIIAGIVIAIVAMQKANRYPRQYGGKQLAMAGLITNIVSFFVLIPIFIIAAIAIPNLLASRRAANEGSAINNLRKIQSAESVYQSTVGNGNFGTLEDLRKEILITPELASGTQHGYRFRIDPTITDVDGHPAFIAVAVPVEYPSTGRRSFFIDETGVMRGADGQGSEATKYDPPLNFERDYSATRSASGRSRQTDDE